MNRVVLFVLLLLTACAVPGGADTPPNGSASGGTNNGDGPPERVFGTIEYGGEAAEITVPKTALKGEPFSVTVLTYGDGCTEVGETDVRLETRRAEIRPYDYNVAPGQTCDTVLKTLEHTASLVFTETGDAEIVFFGQSVSTEGTTNTRVTRTVTVQ